MAKNTNLKLIGRRLKHYRISRGYTQREVAEYIGCQRSAYAMYETGAAEMGATRLIDVASVLNVTPNDICGVRAGG